MRIKVTINFNEKDVNDVYIDETALPALANVANARAALVGNSTGFNGFQLSENSEEPVSPLDGRTQLFPETGYPGIITSEVSGADGSCNIAIPFVLSGNTPAYIFISFNEATKEYASRFRLSTSISSKTYTVTDNTSTFVMIPLDVFELQGTLGLTTFTLTIYKWSKANASIKISAISTRYTLSYTGTDLLSVTNSENLLDAQMQIAPGICEQYADVSVYDRRGVLRKFALANKLTPDHALSIVAIDDADAISYELGNYIISDWNFDGISSTVGISCRDKSYLFEKINIERAVIADRTLDELISILFAQATGMPWKYQDTETRTRCERIVVPNSWYHASDLYTMLNKICALGMLRIYWYIDTFIVGRCC